MKTGRMRGAALAASVAALGLVAGAPSASGDGGAKTKITIKKLRHTGASGVIRSEKAKCEGAGREVQFFRLDGFVSVKIDRVKTRSGGKWRVRKDLKPGKYFAKVDATPGCRYDVSKNERLR